MQDIQFPPSSAGSLLDDIDALASFPVPHQPDPFQVQWHSALARIELEADLESAGLYQLPAHAADTACHVTSRESFECSGHAPPTKSFVSSSETNKDTFLVSGSSSELNSDFGQSDDFCFESVEHRGCDGDFAFHAFS
eukprot:2301087-Rhodomonas_salina.1